MEAESKLSCIESNVSYIFIHVRHIIRARAKKVNFAVIRVTNDSEFPFNAAGRMRGVFVHC